MDRRKFLQALAATPVAAKLMPNSANAAPFEPVGSRVCEFTDHGVTWKVFEDLATRDGAITFTAACRFCVA